MFSHHTIKANAGARRKSRALGRGDGSGAGSYSGHGGKGQTARSGGKLRAQFEGGQTPLIRRMPKLKGFKNVNRINYNAVNVEDLEAFDAGSTVTIIELYERKLVAHKSRPVKILGDGELTKKLTVKVDATSASARKKIEAAGGSLVIPKPKPTAKEAAPAA